MIIPNGFVNVAMYGEARARDPEDPESDYVYDGFCLTLVDCIPDVESFYINGLTIVHNTITQKDDGNGNIVVDEFLTENMDISGPWVWVGFDFFPSKGSYCLLREIDATTNGGKNSHYYIGTKDYRTSGGLFPDIYYTGLAGLCDVPAIGYGITPVYNFYGTTGSYIKYIYDVGYTGINDVSLEYNKQFAYGTVSFYLFPSFDSGKLTRFQSGQIDWTSLQPANSNRYGNNNSVDIYHHDSGYKQFAGVIDKKDLAYSGFSGTTKKSFKTRIVYLDGATIESTTLTGGFPDYLLNSIYSSEYLYNNKTYYIDIDYCTDYYLKYKSGDNVLEVVLSDEITNWGEYIGITSTDPAGNDVMRNVIALDYVCIVSQWFFNDSKYGFMPCATDAPATGLGVTIYTIDSTGKIESSTANFTYTDEDGSPYFYLTYPNDKIVLAAVFNSGPWWSKDVQMNVGHGTFIEIPD